MSEKKLYVTMLLAIFFLGEAHASTLFFDDFESDLSQWNFPSPNLHGFTGAHMSIADSEAFEGLGSATFGFIVVAGNALTDRIPVTEGSTYRLQIAYKGPVDKPNKGWVGFSLFGSNSDSSYIREHWMMGPRTTNDFETAGPIKPDGDFDMQVFGPANNLVWDATSDWKVYEASFVIPEQVNHLNVKLDGNSRVFFDNIRLELVPEPSSFVLLGTGLIGGLTFLRKRNRFAD